MKKFFTLRNIILLAGAFILVLFFFLSFAGKCVAYVDGYKFSYNLIVWGSNSLTMEGHKVPVSDLGIGVDHFQPSALLLVGFILMLLAAIGAVLVALLVKKPFAKWIIVACAGVALIGAIFQFLAKDSFARAYIGTLAKGAGMTKEEIREAIAEFKGEMTKAGAKFVLNVLAGVFGIIGAGAIGVSQFLPEKK